MHALQQLLGHSSVLVKQRSPGWAMGPCSRNAGDWTPPLDEEEKDETAQGPAHPGLHRLPGSTAKGFRRIRWRGARAAKGSRL